MKELWLCVQLSLLAGTLIHKYVHANITRLCQQCQSRIIAQSRPRGLAHEYTKYHDYRRCFSDTSARISRSRKEPGSQSDIHTQAPNYAASPTRRFYQYGLEGPNHLHIQQEQQDTRSRSPIQFLALRRHPGSISGANVQTNSRRCGCRRQRWRQ